MAEVQSLSFRAIGRKYGVSDNAVRKWIRFYEYQRQVEGEQAGPLVAPADYPLRS